MPHFAFNGPELCHISTPSWKEILCLFQASMWINEIRNYNIREDFNRQAHVSHNHSSLLTFPWEIVALQNTPDGSLPSERKNWAWVVQFLLFASLWGGSLSEGHTQSYLLQGVILQGQASTRNPPAFPSLPETGRVTDSLSFCKSIVAGIYGISLKQPYQDKNDFCFPLISISQWIALTK